MATGYCWTDSSAIPVEEYMQYWLERIHETGQVERPDWDRYWRDLGTEKIAKPEDRENFDRDFTKARRDSATPRPGIRCAFDWRLDEAERLDDRGHLRNAVRARINQLLEALDEERINPE
jgi:hypothetical protein